MKAGFIATGTLLAASIGGWVAGILGDPLWQGQKS